MTPRERIAACAIPVVSGLGGLALCTSGYAFCGVSIMLGIILPLPIALIADQHSRKWGCVTNLLTALIPMAVLVWNAGFGPEKRDPVMVAILYGFLVLPIFCLLSFVVSLPIHAVRTARDKKRALKLGRFCLNCNYDLRGSIDRCPECGTPFPPPTHAETWNDMAASDRPDGYKSY